MAGPALADDGAWPDASGFESIKTGRDVVQPPRGVEPSAQLGNVAMQGLARRPLAPPAM